MDLTAKIEQAFLKKGLPPFRPGDTIRVFAKVKEGDKERLQPFEGIVIRKRGCGTKATMTVRKISYGIGVERIFPLCSPMIDRVEVVQKGKARRARLYYLRGLKGKKARMEQATNLESPAGEQGAETAKTKSAKI